MTISPTLAAQFELLANLAVVTNVIPYMLCAGPDDDPHQGTYPQ